MEKNYLFLLSFIFLFLGVNTLSAQKIKRSTGNSQVRVENNVTKQEARKKAEEQAKIDAITNAFGAYVEQETNLTVESGKSRFNIIGSTKVKGEWVETLDLDLKEEPREVEGEYGPEQEIWITCNIRGKVKEATPKANIEAYPLNYKDPKSKTFTFTSGDNMYLYFRSPIDGYLTIFLDDNNKIYRLIPDGKKSTGNNVQVKADEEYILFSENSSINKGLKAEPLYMITSNESEMNKLHIIFSEKNFFKPILSPRKKEEESEYTIPHSVSRINFEEWMADNKTAISDFQDYPIHIEILGE